MPVTIAIIGPRASGKTTVARALSSATGLAMADTDAMVSALHGPIREQFAKDGEAVFREREEQALREALARGGVVSCGGGIVTRRTNRLLLATVHTVFLSAPIETLVARFLADPCTADQRPPLSRTPRTTVRRRPARRPAACCWPGCLSTAPVAVRKSIPEALMSPRW